MILVDWLPELAAHWSSGRLKWLGQIYAGGTPNRDNPEYWTDGTIPWLNSGSVNDWAVHEPSELITELGMRKSNDKEVHLYFL